MKNTFIDILCLIFEAAILGFLVSISKNPVASVIAWYIGRIIATPICNKILSKNQRKEDNCYEYSEFKYLRSGKTLH